MSKHSDGQTLSSRESINPRGKVLENFKEISRILTTNFLN